LKWAFIYTLDDPAESPRVDNIGTLVCVGIRSIADAPAVVPQLLAEGVEMIELCGGFGDDCCGRGSCPRRRRVLWCGRECWTAAVVWTTILNRGIASWIYLAGMAVFGLFYARLKQSAPSISVFVVESLAYIALLTVLANAVERWVKRRRSDKPADFVSKGASGR
jgi:hypothetical protein